MTAAPSIAWKRLAIEAPIIVISILLAFAIDAWWQERGDRQAEIVLLERLQSDFLEIQTALEVVADEHNEAHEACLYFLDMSVGQLLPATPEVDRMVAVVFLASRTFNPGSGAVAAFQNSESASLIRNEALADKLLAWPGLVEELQEEEANLQKGVAERWSPYIASRVSIGPFVSVVDLAQAIPERIAAPMVRQPFLVDEDFHNHVLDRYKWQQIALRDIEPVQAAVADILELIEIELGH